MKKILLILCIFIIGTSHSIAIDIDNSTLISNSEIIKNDFPTIKYENYILIPIQNFLNLLNINYIIKISNDENLIIQINDIQIELFPNSYDAIINSTPVSLVVPAIKYGNDIYISTNLINDLTDLYIHYDSLSNSIFATSKNYFKQTEFFFNRVEKILKNFNSINIDIINEVNSPNNTSYSVGTNIYIDRTLNKVFQKNILDNNWKESNVQLSYIHANNFNAPFFIGISVDRINSNNDYIIFKGYYPLDDKITKATLYINPHTLQLEKQISEFLFEGNLVRQTVFYNFQ